jgi:hypothetical protein
VLPILAVLAGAFAVYAAKPATRAAPASRPAEVDHAARPISYFNAKCADCHGPYGSFWGDGFASYDDPAELRAVVEEMAAGPAFSPLEGRALDVQTAYNHSLSTTGRAEGPFVVARRRQTTLRGEMTPNADIKVSVDGALLPVDVREHAWSVELENAGNAVVRVRLGDATTEIVVPASSLRYSHGSAVK